MERTHYKCPNYSAEEIAAPLWEQYRLLCAMRGKVVKNEDDVKGVCMKVAKWLTDPSTKGWLFILGNVGTGKTTLMNAISVIQGRMQHISNNVPHRWGSKTISALDLPRYARDEDMERDYRDLMAGTDSRPFLYLDDVGQEPVEVKSFGNSLIPFVEIVHKRYSTQRPMVITSNLTIRDILERYGERVADRMKEMTEVVNFRGQSYR